MKQRSGNLDTMQDDWLYEEYRKEKVSGHKNSKRRSRKRHAESDGDDDDFTRDRDFKMSYS